MASNLAWQCWKIQLTGETVTSGMKNHEFRRGLSQILGLTTWSSAAFSNPGTYHQPAGAHAARQQSIMPHGVEHYHALQGRFLWDLIRPYELGGWWSFGYDELLISRIEKNLWTFYIILQSLHLFLEKRCNFSVYQRGADPCLISVMCRTAGLWNHGINLQKRLLLPKLRADNYPPVIIAT